MRPAAVVEAEIAVDPGAGFGDAGIGPQVDFLVFYGPPQTLYEDVVPPSALSVHADLDLAGGQHLDEVGRGELAALIRVEYLGRAVTPLCQRSCPPLCFSSISQVGGIG